MNQENKKHSERVSLPSTIPKLSGETAVFFFHFQQNKSISPLTMCSGRNNAFISKPTSSSASDDVRLQHKHTPHVISNFTLKL